MAMCARKKYAAGKWKQEADLALSEVTAANAGARVDRRGLFKDEVGLDELANSLACEKGRRE